MNDKLFLVDDPLIIKKQIIHSLKHKKVKLYDLSDIFIRLI